MTKYTSLIQIIHHIQSLTDKKDSFELNEIKDKMHQLYGIEIEIEKIKKHINKKFYCVKDTKYERIYN